MSAIEPATPRTKPSRWSLLLNLVLLLALGAVSAGWYFSARNLNTEQAAPTAVKPLLPAPALYYALEPQFVVNLAGSPFDTPQYLQIEVQLMTRDPRVHSALAQHAPAIRARLLLLFAQQTLDAIADRESKEHLQARALEEVRSVIRNEIGSEGIDALLFTSFVTQ